MQTDTIQFEQRLFTSGNNNYIHSNGKMHLETGAEWGVYNANFNGGGNRSVRGKINLLKVTKTPTEIKSTAYLYAMYLFKPHIIHTYIFR